MADPRQTSLGSGRSRKPFPSTVSGGLSGCGASRKLTPDTGAAAVLASQTQSPVSDDLCFGDYTISLKLLVLESTSVIFFLCYHSSLSLNFYVRTRNRLCSALGISIISNDSFLTDLS